MIHNLKKDLFGVLSDSKDITYINYALCARVGMYYGHQPYMGLEFEKRLCRSGFRKSFGLNLNPCFSAADKSQAVRLQYGLSLDLDDSRESSDQNIATEEATLKFRSFPLSRRKPEAQKQESLLKPHFVGPLAPYNGALAPYNGEGVKDSYTRRSKVNIFQTVQGIDDLKNYKLRRPLVEAVQSIEGIDLRERQMESEAETKSIWNLYIVGLHQPLMSAT
jgi:hypothetical protein